MTFLLFYQRFMAVLALKMKLKKKSLALVKLLPNARALVKLLPNASSALICFRPGYFQDFVLRVKVVPVIQFICALALNKVISSSSRD